MANEERQSCGKEYARIFYFGVPIFFIIAFMICGNLMVVISVLRYKNLHSIRNGIIASLALADLLVALAVVPFAAIDLICRRWIFPPSYCISYVALDFISCQSSIFHICLIAVEQYVVINSPLRYGRIRRVVKVGVILAVCGVWALSIVIAYYFTYYASRSGNLSNKHGHESNLRFKLNLESDVNVLVPSQKHLGDESCLYLSKLSPSFALIVFLGGFLVPMVITMLVYWKIYGIARYHLNSLLNQYDTTLSQQQLNLKKSKRTDLVKSIEMLTSTPDMLNELPFHPPLDRCKDKIKRHTSPNGHLILNNLEEPRIIDSLSLTRKIKQCIFSTEKPVKTLRFQLVKYDSNDNVVTSLVPPKDNRIDPNNQINKFSSHEERWTKYLDTKYHVNDPYTINLTSDSLSAYGMRELKRDNSDTTKDHILANFSNLIETSRVPGWQNCQCQCTKNILVNQGGKRLSNREDTLKMALNGNIGATVIESDMKYKIMKMDEQLLKLYDNYPTGLTNDFVYNTHQCESIKANNGLQRRSTSHSYVNYRRSTESQNSKVLRRCSSGYGSTLLYTPPTTHICMLSQSEPPGKECRAEELSKKPAAAMCKKSQGAASKRESNIYVHIQTNRNMLKEGKAIKTLGIVLGAFLMCWTPYFCLFLIHPLCNHCIPVKLFVFVTWLGYMNSALNPIIYAIYNKKFRRAFKSLLFCHIMKRSVINAN